MSTKSQSKAEIKPLLTHKIGRGIHAAFGEFFGRVIYDGIWVGCDSDIENIRGIRRDVIDGCADAGITAFRWPGGCCADHYHWKDGVGKKRYDRIHFASNGDKSTKNRRNDFGTDECVDFCRLCGMEPVFTANAATGSAEEFYDWFEYCNGDTNTRYGSMRAENGHEAPFNVMKWGIGNTDENVWHASLPSDFVTYSRDYLKMTAPFTQRSALWPELRFIGLGVSIRHNLPGWTEGSLDYITNGGRRMGPDFLSIHHYLGGMKDRKCGGGADYTDEEYEYTLDSLVKYQQDIDTHRKIIAEHTHPANNTKIAVDEWGLWHPEADDRNQLRQPQTMRDAVFAGLALHIFYRNSDIVAYAMETQLSNLLQSLFETRGGEFYKTPTFYIMKMYRDHLEQYMLPADIICEGGAGECFASAAKDMSKITVTCVCRDLYKSMRLRIPDEFAGFRTVKSDIVSCSDVRAQNTFDTPDMIKSAPFVPLSDNIELPPFSVARFVLEK